MNALSAAAPGSASGSASASAAGPVSEAIWSEHDTTPSAVDDALRALLRERHGTNHSFAPARVLNMVTIADRDWRGEIANRLDRVGRFHPSRSILCDVEAGRQAIDARITVTAPESVHDGGIALGHENIELTIGPQHLDQLETLVDPLLISDLTTVLWAPHGHDDGIEALRKVGQVVLYDSVERTSVEDGLARAIELSSSFHVVDLAWMRSTPWRERIAMSFDPPALRPELRRITGIAVRHHPDYAVSGLLLVGWLASRLGWRPGAMVQRPDLMHGRCRGQRQDVEVQLSPVDEPSAPGLAGITVETASGLSLSLDRGPGGLHAVRTTRDGRTSSWVVMGASRGEAGILGMGVREALLRDVTYRPAVEAAMAMLG